MTNESTAAPWYWRPNVIVFISSACIMILELVAGRIIAPQVGVSLYTWTSVIGVILAGMSLGNYLGGRLADRAASLRLLGAIFAVGGLTSLGILGIEQLNLIHRVEWPIVVEILVLIGALFFLPATVLGTISPVVVKLAMEDLARAGRTVGRISAFATLGSITGTFATGFWLISWFGTHAVVWGVAVALMALGALFLVAGRWRRGLIAALVVAGIGAGTFALGWAESACSRETNYFCIKVHEEERDGKVYRVLTLDRLVHSFSSLEDPTDLEYDYEKIYAELVDYQAERSAAPLKAFFIGGGGYTFPRYMETLYPESEIDVVEIDPGVTETAYSAMGLDPATSITSYNQDARLYLMQSAEKQYDIIVGDAFNDFSVPYHLTTKEFNERVGAWLAADGYYVVNLIDGAFGQFLRAYVRTLQLTFDHVYVVPRLEQWRDVSRDTFVIVAGDTPLDLDAFDEDARLRQKVLSPDEVTELLAEGRDVILTDRYAPVAQMLAPVFLGRTGGE
jgi:spermidine synthase